MVVAQTFRYDLWSSSDPVREEDLIDVHCLIPNGSYINFKCTSKTTLAEFKEVRRNYEQVNHSHIWGKSRKNTKIALNASLQLCCFELFPLLIAILFCSNYF